MAKEHKKIKPKFVPKVWGNELWLANTDQYCGKLIVVKKGHYCSVHFHKLKHEHFFVLKGSVKLEYMDKPLVTLEMWQKSKRSMILNEGDVVEILPYHLHRFTGLERTNQIIEISTTHFNSDSYRIVMGS